MIHHSNTQKPLQGGRSRLGSRDTRVPVQERKQRNCHLKGHSQLTAGSLLSSSLSFKCDKACNGIWKRWKFQMFVYNWLWGPQPHSEKFLASDWLVSEAGYSPGFRSFVAKQGCQQAQLRLWAGTSCYPSLHVCGNLARTNSSLCLCLDAELSSWSRCRTLQKNWLVSWYFDFKLLDRWHSVFWPEHYFQ